MALNARPLSYCVGGDATRTSASWRATVNTFMYVAWVGLLCPWLSLSSRVPLASFVYVYTAARAFSVAAAMLMNRLLTRPHASAGAIPAGAHSGHGAGAAPASPNAGAKTPETTRRSAHATFSLAATLAPASGCSVYTGPANAWASTSVVALARTARSQCTMPMILSLISALLPPRTSHVSSVGFHARNGGQHRSLGRSASGPSPATVNSRSRTALVSPRPLVWGGFTKPARDGETCAFSMGRPTAHAMFPPSSLSTSTHCSPDTSLVVASRAFNHAKSAKAPANAVMAAFATAPAPSTDGNLNAFDC